MAEGREAGKSLKAENFGARLIFGSVYHLRAIPTICTSPLLLRKKTFTAWDGLERDVMTAHQ